MESNTNTLPLETRGYCLSCLEKLSKELIDHSSKAGSLQKACRYLDIDMLSIFSKAVPSFQRTSEVTKEWEVRGTLCWECEQLFWFISEIMKEVERLQEMYEFFVKGIVEKIEGTVGTEKLKEFKGDMLSNPQTIFHLGIVEQLRKELLARCSSLLPKEKLDEVVGERDVPSMPEVRTSQKGIEEVIISDDDGITTTTPEEPKSQEGESLINIPDEVQEIDSNSTITEIDPLSCEEPVPVPSEEVPKAVRLTCFKCQFCTEVFRWRVALQKHIERRHKENHSATTQTPTKESDIYEFQDEPCTTSTFVRRNSVNLEANEQVPVITSVRSSHEFGIASVASQSIRKFQCNLCPKTYPLISTLRRHKRIKHGFAKLKGGGGGRPKGSKNRAPSSKAPKQKRKQNATLPQTSTMGNGSNEFQLNPQSENNKSSPTESKSKKIGKFKCEVCKCRFTTKGGRDMHRRRAHPDKCYYECNLCKYLFTQISSRNFHRENHCPNNKSIST